MTQDQIKIIFTFQNYNRTGPNENLLDRYYTDTWTSDEYPGYRVEIEYNEIGEKVTRVWFNDEKLYEAPLLTGPALGWVDPLTQHIEQRKNNKIENP